MANESGRSRIALALWGVVILLVLLLVVGLVSGGWVISSKSGCEDRRNTDPDYASANWYGLGIGVCVSE
jgi:Ni/Fe-hydrogenase subunit HybB-like protein